MALTPEEIRIANEIRKQKTQPKSVPVKPVVNTTKEEPSFIKTLMSTPFIAPYQSNPVTAIKDFLNYFSEDLDPTDNKIVDKGVEKGLRNPVVTKEQQEKAKQDYKTKQLEHTKSIYDAQKNLVTSTSYIKDNPEFASKVRVDLFNPVLNQFIQKDQIIDEEINKNLTNLGYTWYNDEDEYSQPYLKRIEDYKPDKQWLENNKKTAFNYTKENETLKEKDINILYFDWERQDYTGTYSSEEKSKDLDARYDKWFSDKVPFASLIDDKEIRSQKIDIRETYNKENNLLMSLYTTPELIENTKSNKFTNLSKVDYNNPDSYNEISKETEAINTLIPKTDLEKQYQKGQFLKSGILLNTYNNPAFSDAEYNKYIRNKEKDTPESQKYYNSTLEIETEAMTQGIKNYQSNLDQIYDNINNLQTAINKYGYQKDWKEQLDKNILLKDKLKQNIKARYDVLDYWNKEKNSLSLYKDYKFQQEKLDKFSENSPITYTGFEFVKHVANILPAALGAISNVYASVLLNDEEKENFAAEKLRSSDNSSMSFIEELGTGKKFGTEQTAEGLVYDETAGDWIKGSKINASPIGLYNKKGEFDPWVNPTATLFQTGKVAFDSYLMGSAMFKANTLFAPTSRGIASAELAARGGSLTEGGLLAAEEVLGAEGAIGQLPGMAEMTGLSNLQKIGFASQRFGTSVAETFVGSIAPSYLMYSDEMLKDELKKGLTFDQAHGIAAIRAGIEGFTERLFPNEMSWYKQMAGIGAIKNYAELTAKEGYANLINRAVEKNLGKRLGSTLYNEIFKPATLPLLEEGAEEVAGLALGEIPNLMAKKMKYDYQPSEEWSPEAAINVMVSTAATMLPMGAGSVHTAFKDYSSSQKAAQYAVGQTPSLYIKAIEDLYDQKSITREEADRRLNFVGKLSNIANDVKEKLSWTPNFEKLTNDQGEELGQAMFNKQVRLDALKAKLIAAPTEEEKLKIAEMYNTEEAQLSKLLERGLFKTDAERVENTKNNTEFYLNDAAINTNTNRKGLVGIVANLKRYAAKETDKGLVEFYNNKIEKLEQRIDNIDKGILSAEEIKIKEKEKEDKVKSETTVTIKGRNKDNKIVDKVLSIGKEYVIGRTLQVKDGKLSFNYPVFKIIGKNEDGTIKIETKNSQETIIQKDVPADYLSSYRIADKEVMDKLPANDPGKIYLRWSNRKVKLSLSPIQQQKYTDLIKKGEKIKKGSHNRVEVEGFLSYENGILYFNFLDKESKIKKVPLDKESAKNIKGVSKKFGGVEKANPNPNQSEEMTLEDFKTFGLGNELDRAALEKELDEIDNAELERQKEESKNTFYKVFENYLLKLKKPLNKLENKLSTFKGKIEILTQNIELLDKIKEVNTATKEELEKIFTTRAEKIIISKLFSKIDLKKKNLQKRNDSLKNEIDSLKTQIEELPKTIEALSEKAVRKRELLNNTLVKKEEELSKKEEELLKNEEDLNNLEENLTEEEEKTALIFLVAQKMQQSTEELEKTKEEVKQITYDVEVQNELFKEQEEEFKALFDEEDEESGKDAYEVLSERKKLITDGLRLNRALLKTLNNKLNKVNALLEIASQTIKKLISQFISKFPKLTEIPPISSIKEDDPEKFKKAVLSYNRRMEEAIKQADEKFDYEILGIDSEDLTKKIEETTLAIEQAQKEAKQLDSLLKKLQTEKEKLDKQNTILKKQEVLKAILGESTAESSETGVTDTKETEETKKTEKESSKKSIFQWFSSTISGNIENYADYWNDSTNNFAARRLHYFLNNIENSEDIQLLFVTAKSVPDKLKGVIYIPDGSTEYDPNDIKVIFVKIINGQRKFIDANGIALDDDKINPSNVVYTSLPKEETASKMTWANGEKSTREKELEGYSEEQKTKIIEDSKQSFIDLRNKVLASTEPMDFTIESISNGIPNKIKGVELEDGTIEFQRTPVQSSILRGVSINLNNTPVIQIGTKPDENGLTSVQINGTLVNMPVGKPFINWGNKFAFLNNRKFSQNEVDKLVNLVFILYTKAKLNAVKQIDSPEEKVKILDLEIINYLKKVIFWKNPAVGNKVSKPSVNQMWLDGEGLHIGEAIIPFTPETFEENQAETRLALETFFENAYHTVDNKKLTDTGFQEITEILSDNFTKNGSIDFKKLEKLIQSSKNNEKLYNTEDWESYQSYLISNKNPNGTERTGDVIPLTTSLHAMPSLDRLLQGDTQVPLIGKYVTFNYEGKPTIPEKESKSAKTSKTNETKENTATTERFLPNKEELLQSATERVEAFPDSELVPKRKSLIIKAYERFFNLTEGIWTLEERKETLDDGIHITKVSKIKLTLNGDVFDIEELEIFDEDLAEKRSAQYLKDIFKGGGINEFLYFKKEVEKEASKEEQSTETTKAETTSTTKTSTDKEDFTEGDVLNRAFGFTEEDTKETPDKTPDKTDNYRVAKPGIYTLENIEAAKAWLAQVMPQISFKDVVGLIDKVAWGKFVKNGIILSNLAEVGTIFHEAFEAVVGLFLNNREWNTIKRQFRNRLGSFVERETGKIIKYSEATDKQVVEEVSEEYREFGLTGKKWVGEAKKNNLFRRMLDTINAFLFGDAKTIEEVFERINNAYYADKEMLPVARNFGIKPNYRIADVEETQFYYDVNQSITHTLLTTLLNEDISVYNLLEGTVDIKNIYSKVLKNINLEIAPTKELIQLYVKNDKDWVKAINQTKNPLPLGWEGNEKDINKIEAAVFININWKQLVDANIETLRKKYNILLEQQTDQNEEFTNEDTTNSEEYEEGTLTPEEQKEGKSRNDYTFSDFEVDVKKNAAASVKLMIATLGQRTLAEGFDGEGLPKTKLLRNSLGLYMPVDFYKTFNNLLNIMTSSDVAVTNFDEFMNALKSNIITHPEFYGLYNRLKPKNPNNLTQKEHKLKLDFTKTFNKLKVGFIRQIVTKQEIDRDTREVTQHSSVNVIDSKQNSEVRVIKESWFSNINANKDDSTIFKIEKGNYKILPKAFNDSKYELNTPDSNKNLENAYKIAEKLGLTTSLNLKKLKDSDKKIYISIINDIKSFIKGGEAEIILGKDTNFIGSINKLAEFEHKHLKTSVELNHLNIDGKLQHDITGLNTFGIIVKDILASKSLEEIMQRNPHLKDIGVRLSAWKNMIFDEVTNKKIGKIVIQATEGLQFDREKEGKDNSKLDPATKFMSEFNDNLKGFYHIFVTADSKTEWIYSFINSLNKNTPFTNFTKTKTVYTKFFRNYLKNEILLARDFYTNTERRRVAELQQKMNTPFSKGRQKGISLGFFDSILTFDSVYSDVIDLKLQDNSIEAQDKMVDSWLDLNEDLILDDLDNFINEMSNQTKEFMIENGIIVGNRVNLLEVDTGNANNNTFNENSIDNLIRLRQINYMINMFEQFNMFWGSPNQFSDATKRIKSFASTREPMSYDEKQLDVSSAFDEYANANFNIVSGEEMEAVNLTENDRGFQNFDGTLTSLVLKDVKVVLDDVESFTKHVLNEHSKSFFSRSLDEISEYMLEYLKDKFKYFIDPYYDIDEPDGQAVMTLPTYRQFLRRAVMWTDQMEEQYQYEMAYERLAINKYKNDTLKKIDKYLVEVKGNPNTQNLSKGKEFNVFPVLKPIGAGYKSGDIFITSLDKMSVIPLFYRALEGRKGLEIYNYLQDNKIGYARYESANKVGRMTSPVGINEIGKIRSIYNPDGTINIKGAPNTDTLLYKYFAIQVETSGQKTYTTRGSQVTKTSVSNLTIAGLPIDLVNPIIEKAIQDAIDSEVLQDPQNLKEEKDIEKYLIDSRKVVQEATQTAIEMYSKLSPEELEEISPIQKVVNQHNNALFYLTQIGKEELFKKYNIKEEDGSYQITDVERFVELIKTELDQRDTPKNIIDAIKASPNKNELEVPIDMIVGGEKLESLLMSVIDKSIASPKLLGGGKPQVASTLFEKNKRNLVMKTQEGWVKVEDYSKLTSKEKEGVKITSNELHFYTPEKPWIEVLLPYKYKDLIAKSLGKDGEIDKELLKMIGFRIPNQSLNSTENIRVKGFLPESYGDMIVVPSAIVTKAGSDFDIDKLNMYMFNFFFNKDGIAKKIEFLDKSNSTVKERYNRYVMDKASRDEIDYINYLSSAEFGKIKDEFANQLTSIKNNLFNLRKESIDEQRDIYLNTIQDLKDITNTERKNYAGELLFIGRGLFRTLNKNLKQPLWDNHENHLLNKVKGAAAITSHRDLVSDMLLEKKYRSENEKNTLLDMIDVYDQQLKLYGRDNSFNIFYQKEKEEVLKKFREGKDITKSEYIIKYQKQKNTFSYVENLAKSVLNNEKIAELAKMIGLKSEDDFKELPIELQNTKKALENRYVETLMQIIELPENFKQLVTPNSAKILSDRAEHIRDLKGEAKESKSNGNFLNPVYTNKTRYSFQIGKDAIGIAAIGITNHALNQLWNVYLKSNNIDRQEKLNRFTVLFPTNSITITKQDGTIEKVSSLSFILDDEGNWISDNLSAFANAYVDVAKDPFIFSLNGNMTTAGPYATANKLGIGINKLTLLFTQPIVEDYIKLEERRKGILGKAIGMTQSIVNSIIDSKYGTVSSEKQEAMTEEELESMIKTKYKDLTPEQKQLQVSILESYKLLNDINNDIRDFVGSYNYDTSNIGNVSAVDIKKYAQEKTKQKVAKGDSFVQGSAPTKSFFREIDKSYSEYVEAISSLFFTKSVAGQQTLNPIFLRLFDIFDSNEKEKAINTLKKGYINYLFLKTPITLIVKGKEVNLTIGEYYSALLISKNNTAKLLKKIQKDVKDGKIKKSVILEKLFPMTATEERKTHNIKMFDRIKEAEHSDMIVNSLLALKDNALTSELGNLLELTALVQSGLSMSKISFSQYLSNKSLISVIAKQIKENPLINQKDFLSLFYANSWQNNTLTPTVKNYRNKTYTAGFLFGEEAKEILEKEGYKDSFSYVALDLYDKEGKINNFGANPLKSFQIKKIEYIYNQETKKKEPVVKIFQQVTDEQGNPVLFNQTNASFLVDGKIKTGINAKVIYKEVTKRGLGQYGLEYGDKTYTFPSVKTVPNNILISLRTAGFNMTLDQILEQSFEDAINSEVVEQPIQNSQDIYSQLGNKTKSENIVIKPWGELKDAKRAITSGGIISTRIKMSDAHFGNPFTSDTRLQNLIQVKSTKEAVERYINWIITGETGEYVFTGIQPEDLENQREWILEQLQSGELKNKPILYYKELGEPSHATALDYLINKYNWNVNQPTEIKPKIDISNSTKKSPYFKKDKIKFAKANKLISRGSSNSSSEAYRIAVGNKANTGNYVSTDIVGISSEGSRTGRIKPDFNEIQKAINVGVTFITDTKTDRSRDYNIGEREVADYLSKNGYKETQDGVWNKPKIDNSKKIEEKEIKDWKIGDSISITVNSRKTSIYKTKITNIIDFEDGTFQINYKDVSNNEKFIIVNQDKTFEEPYDSDNGILRTVELTQEQLIVKENAPEGLPSINRTNKNCE